MKKGASRLPLDVLLTVNLALFLLLIASNTAAEQNADATLVPATQTVYYGSEHATRIILPWIPADGAAPAGDQ